MGWKIAYRWHLRKRLAQNEVAMEFVNECRAGLERAGVEVKNIQLAPDQFSVMRFHIGTTYIEFYVYLDPGSDLKWRLSSFGTALVDGYDYDAYKFYDAIEDMIARYADADERDSYGDAEDARDSYYDVPEVYNMSPYGPIRER